MAMTYSRKKHGNIFSIQATLPENYLKAKIEITSDRNNVISKFSDVSPMDPDKTPGKVRYPADIDIWFPVTDVRLETGMCGVAQISGADYCQINSYFNPERTPVINGEALFPAAVLSDWENGLFLPSKAAQVERFSVVKTFFAAPTIGRTVFAEFEAIAEDWGGIIALCYQDSSGCWKRHGEIEIKREKDQTFDEKGVEDLETSLNFALDYIVHSYNRSLSNPYRDGLFLFYDADADTYRNTQWPWSWGTAIRLLLDCAKIKRETKPAIRIHRSAEELTDIAYQLGLTTLKFQIDNPEHPAHGFGTTRYTPRNFSTIGYEELVNSGSDTGFLCGWGWAALYEATGDKRFLDATERYLQALVPLLDDFPIPPQEWLPEPKRWTDFTIDESGFGTEGIDGAFRMTGDKKYQALCEKYMDKHLALFEREDGLWERQYTFSTGEVSETLHMTRGLGWAMEGLLAAHRCAPCGGKYLEKAKKMADVLIQYQCGDGSWCFRFTLPSEEYGAADKGTSLWALLLYMLYGETKEEKYLSAAKAALKWCMKNQYTGSNPHAKGGIIGVSGESGITYRGFFRLCCQYTSAFMGLAILEEVKASKEIC